MPRPYRAGGRLSVCRVHRNRQERPRKTKIGTEVAHVHVTRDSDTTFKVRGQLAGGGVYCGDLPHSLLQNDFCKHFNTASYLSLYSRDLRTTAVLHQLYLRAAKFNISLSYLRHVSSIIFTVYFFVFVKICA